ncbi:TIGR01906 family membrane protein, partial [Acinetobacter sp. RIT592]
MNRILSFLISLGLSLFIITSVVSFTVKFKQIYYFDINYLNIPILSDMNEEEIK